MTRTRLIAGACSLAAIAALGLTAATSVGAAAPPKARVPSPTVVSMAASSTPVKPSGIRVVVVATTSHARFCRFATSPRLGKVVTGIDCSKNRFRRAVLVPANTTPYVKSYTFTLTASGRGGSATKSLVIKQLPPEPSITHRTITPRRPDHYGGRIRLRATVRSAVRCWLTASRGIRLSSKLFRCPTSVDRTVTMPQNFGAYGRTFFVTLHARNPVYVTTAGYKLVQPAAPPTFLSFGSRPQRIGSGGGKVTVAAKFIRAQTCYFSYEFPNGGGGSAGRCNGSFAQTLRIPRNHSGHVRLYTFTLKLRGRGGKAGEEYTLIQPSS